MADFFINPTGPGTPDSMHLVIDSDSDESDRLFTVEHDGGGAGKELLVVSEAGTVTIFGSLSRLGTVVFNNIAGGNVASFESGGSQRVAITATGVGVFGDGVRLPVNSDALDPDAASLPGDYGDIVRWFDPATSTPQLWACNDGLLNTWNQVIP